MKPTEPPSLRQEAYQFLRMMTLLLLAVGAPCLLNAFALEEQVFSSVMRNELRQQFFFNYVFGVVFTLSGLIAAIAAFFHRRA